MSNVTEHTNRSDQEKSAKSNPKRITAEVAFRVNSAFAWLTPFMLFIILQIFGSPLLAIALAGFFIVIVVPAGVVAHLAMKPIIHAENGTIIVIPHAGGAWKWQVRKPPGTYQMKLLPNGRIELKCLPWYSNFRPGGPLPSRRHLIPRTSDREEWIALAK